MRQSNDRVSGDPRQDRRERRGFNPTVPHDENILAARFRNIAFTVEHDRFVVSALFDLGFRENRVDVVARSLAFGHHHVDMMSGIGGHLGANAVLESVIAEIGSPGPYGDAHVHRVIRDIDTQLAESQKSQRPDVTRF